MYYKYHKINSDHGGSYVAPPNWRKKKKAIINPINKKDNKCFQYAVTVAANHKEKIKNPERIAKIKPFINKYKWEGKNFQSEKDGWKII